MKKFLSFVLSLTLIFSLSIPATASSIETKDSVSDQYTITEYTYPITPGTSEWESLETFSERLSVCRIPQDTLDLMTTDALVDAVMEFPFLANVFIYENREIGFANLLNQCDALRELLTRADGPNKLSDVYVSLTSTMETRTSADYDTFGVQVLYPMILEIILGQADVYSEMDYPHQLSTEIAAADYNENKISCLDETIAQSETVITRAVPETPNGTEVDYILRIGLPQFTQAEKDAGNAYVESTFSILKVVSDPNRYYNCHSYAWHSTSTSNIYWINDPSPYMTDGSYSERSSGRSGDKVFYDNPGTETSEVTGEILGDHSAIIVRGSGSSAVVRSKWGELGVYEHYVNRSAYSGDKTDYSYWY